MNIQQIKESISKSAGVVIVSMNMVRQKDSNEMPTVWLSHWDNDNRVRITMHENVLKTIKDGGDAAEALAFKKEIVAAHDSTLEPGTTVAEYQRFVVITPKDVEAVF